MRMRSLRRLAGLALFGLLLVVCVSVAAERVATDESASRLAVEDLRAVPSRIAFQGSLADSAGDPVEGTVDLALAMYADETGGTALWSESQLGVVVTGGHFRIALGSETALPMSLFEGVLPVPAGWCGWPTGFLLLSEDMRDEAARARSLGWSVLEDVGNHMDVVNRAVEVAADLVRIGS